MVVVREFFCAGSRDDVLDKARSGFERKYAEYATHGLQGTDPELVRKVTGDLEGLMDDTFIVGSPDDCVEQIARYRGLGFTQVILRLFYPEMQQTDVMDHIELVGRDLLPNVHKL
jgi:alkanesulfonate monooxygenase SsuD/methylene tetrahydromethanopterin reductase-like flavin-dependent oxidoreductase (luciferase family)